MHWILLDFIVDSKLYLESLLFFEFTQKCPLNLIHSTFFGFADHHFFGELPSLIAFSTQSVFFN